MVAPAAPLVAQTLNPFAVGSSDRLTEMIVALMDDQCKVEAIGVIRSIPSFRAEMLDDIGADESLSEALTRHLGDGEWSQWEYSADDVRGALSSLERHEEIQLRAFRYFLDANADQAGSFTIQIAPDVEAEVGPPTAV
jgi:hypothetical protein